MSDEVKYKFVVKGTTPEGNKARMEGHVWADDGFPSSAFDKAVTCCKELAPGLVVDMSVGGNVVLTKRKTMKTVTAKCVVCGATREIKPNEVPTGEMPMCVCGNLMIAARADSKPKRAANAPRP